MLSRLIYKSRRLCAEDQVSQIVDDARSFNARNDVTGALYLVGDIFIQYLEGDEMVLDDLYSRVQMDSRHTNCRLLDKRQVMLRIFQRWSMAWLVRTPETDRLIDILLPQSLQAADEKGSSAGSFFQALARSAEHR